MKTFVLNAVSRGQHEILILFSLELLPKSKQYFEALRRYRTMNKRHIRLTLSTSISSPTICTGAGIGSITDTTILTSILTYGCWYIKKITIELERLIALTIMFLPVSHSFPVHPSGQVQVPGPLQEPPLPHASLQMAKNEKYHTFYDYPLNKGQEPWDIALRAFLV